MKDRGRERDRGGGGGNSEREREYTRLLERRGPESRGERANVAGKDGGMVEGGRKVGNRTESRRLEVGGTGAEISFYGRVTNLRTRHCRVPADGRTMRLRNTMLHSGNLKAVLTTNLQPPMPPPCMPPSLSSVLAHLRLPILTASTHTTPRSPAASSCSLTSRSFCCRRRRRYFLILSPLPPVSPSTFPATPFRRGFLGLSSRE